MEVKFPEEKWGGGSEDGDCYIVEIEYWLYRCADGMSERNSQSAAYDLSCWLHCIAREFVFLTNTLFTDFRCFRVILDSFCSVICLFLCLSLSTSPSQEKAECTSLTAPTIRLVCDNFETFG